MEHLKKKSQNFYQAKFMQQVRLVKKGRVFPYKYLQHLRLRTQIAIFIAGFTIILLGLLAIFYSIVFQSTVKYSSEAAINIYKRNQLIMNKKIMESYQKTLTKEINLCNSFNFFLITFILEQQKLISLNKIFINANKQIINNNTETQLLDLQNPLSYEYEDFTGDKKIYSYFCYIQENNSSFPLSKSDIQYSYILQGFQDLGQIYSNFFTYAYFEDQNNFFLWSQCPISNTTSLKMVFKTYIPSSRPWYKKAVQLYSIQNDQYDAQIMDPYFSKALIIKNINLDPDNVTLSFTILMPIIDQFREFKGAWALDFNSTYLTAGLQKQKLSRNQDLLLITSSGALIHHKFDLKHQIPLYIQNTSLTGFTDQDFQQMVKFATNQKYTSNCTQIYDIESMLCLYNIINQENLQIQAKYLSNLDIYIVMQTKIFYQYYSIELQILMIQMITQILISQDFYQKSKLLQPKQYISSQLYASFSSSQFQQYQKRLFDLQTQLQNIAFNLGYLLIILKNENLRFSYLIIQRRMLRIPAG